MRRLLPYLICGFFSASLELAAQPVHVVALEGSINPVASDFIHRSIECAHRANAQCLVIQLNTPGGLLQSTRVMVRDILEAPLPVVVYVSPYGAHAGSAGVFITMAGHVAAMSPGTNIGAAHPVSLQQQMDSIMSDKATNDAAAFIRTIAQHRKRDTAWAEEAVRKSVSITAKEALEKGVIDLVASNLEHLLSQLNGKVVDLAEGKAILRTAGAPVVRHHMNWMERLLFVLVDPNIAYILMLVGIYGVFFELYSPGSIFPGVIGGISLIFAFYAMHTLPVNYAGLALILFAIILFLLEIKVTSYGMLTIGGVIALLLGSLMLFRHESPLELVRLSRWVVFPAVAFTLMFFVWFVFLGISAQRRKIVTGAESIPGSIGLAQDDFEEDGYVMVMGELWKARSRSGPVARGQQVRVTGRNRFVLEVEPIRKT
jgi:membrane-bound serine protease (ClpP class)